MNIAIRSTAIGVFDSRTEAENAICCLLEAEFGPNQVGIVLPDALVPASSSREGDTHETRPTAVWAGTMFRSLIGAEFPDTQIRYYEEALEDRRTLVMVRAAERYPEAMAILSRFGGEYLAAF